MGRGGWEGGKMGCGGGGGGMTMVLMGHHSVGVGGWSGWGGSLWGGPSEMDKDEAVVGASS